MPENKISANARAAELRVAKELQRFADELREENERLQAEKLVETLEIDQSEAPTHLTQEGDDDFPEITRVDSEDEHRDSKTLDEEVDHAFDDIRTKNRLGERKQK